MAESTPINFQAFTPYNGGVGARMTGLSSVSARVAIPGLEGGQGDDRSRVLVTNPNGYSVFIRMGNKVVDATLSSLEIVAGNSVLLKPPNIGSQAIWMAAVVEFGSSATVSVCAGEGS